MGTVPHWAVCGAGCLEGAGKAPNTVPGPTEVPMTRLPLLRRYPQEARDGGLRARECFSGLVLQKKARPREQSGHHIVFHQSFLRRAPDSPGATGIGSG